MHMKSFMSYKNLQGEYYYHLCIDEEAEVQRS